MPEVAVALTVSIGSGSSTRQYKLSWEKVDEVTLRERGIVDSDIVPILVAESLMAAIVKDGQLLIEMARAAMKTV